jgi:pimeloyl-ACP methyl ester carboxylesterase
MREKAVLFGKTKSLVGIITEPTPVFIDNGFPAIVFVNSGLLHRVGPHRLYVKAARKLAGTGFLVFRFDFSGIGDSRASEAESFSDKRAIGETREALDYLNATQGIERFILIGICSGAILSYKTAFCDPRVVGIVPINAPVYFDGTEQLRSSVVYGTVARHYWKSALFSLNSWRRAIKGRSRYKQIWQSTSSQIKRLFVHKKEMSSGTRDLVADLHVLSARGISPLFIYSGGDRGLGYLQTRLGDEIHELKKYGKLRIEVIQDTDHTFTPLCKQQHLIETLLDWAQGLVRS